jgi:hypothetical protein
LRNARDGRARLLVYCSDYKCSHSVAISADRWPDDVRLSDLEPLKDVLAKNLYRFLRADNRPLLDSLCTTQRNPLVRLSRPILPPDGSPALPDDFGPFAV